MADSKKTRKTPEQLATERLGVAQRKVDALTSKRDKAKADASEAEAALTEATARRDYLARDPALPYPVDGVDEAPILPCPECAAGKHGNCTGQVPVDGDTDAMVTCPCDHDPAKP